MGRSVRILGKADVREVLDMASCIDACERAFAAYSSGRAETPGMIHLDIPEHRGEVHVKAGHLHGASRYAVKVASGSYATDPPSFGGLVLVFDSATGAPEAILLDDGYITDQRTAAAGAVAARHLARRDVRTVAVIGTSTQARKQVEALAAVRPGFSFLRVWGRDADKARRCADDLRRAPWLPVCTVETAPTVQTAVEGADVVITCTASRAPLLRAEWLAPGSHVTAVGSDGADKQELDPDVLASADLLVVDSREQCATIGELHHALDAGSVDTDSAIELGEICAGSHPGRISDDQRTVCDLTGLGVQDVAAAIVVMERAGTVGETFEP